MSNKDWSVLAVISPSGEIEGIYSDNLAKALKAAGHSIRVERFSSVDPILPPRWYEWLAFWRFTALAERRRFTQTFGHGYFGIFWVNKMRKHGQTLTDNGQPFENRQAALDFEVSMIQTRYFMNNT